MGSASEAASRSRWERRAGQAGSSVSPGSRVSACWSMAWAVSGPASCSAATREAVEVALGGVAEQQPRVLLAAEQGGGGLGGVVAGQDAFEQVGRGRRVGAVGMDEGAGEPSVTVCSHRWFACRPRVSIV